MNAFQFIAHARTNGFTPAQVRAQLPGLPLHICERLLDGRAYVESVVKGVVTVDDGN